jgi:hypothetical protein
MSVVKARITLTRCCGVSAGDSSAAISVLSIAQKVFISSACSRSAGSVFICASSSARSSGGSSLST